VDRGGVVIPSDEVLTCAENGAFVHPTTARTWDRCLCRPRDRLDPTVTHLTTRQIAAVLGRDESIARRRIARWRVEGVEVSTATTGGRPTMLVPVDAVALRAGLDVGDVMALAMAAKAA